MSKRLLLTGCFPYTEEQFHQLQSLGYTTYFMQQEANELPIEPSAIDATVCNGLFLYHDIDAFENLKLIQLTSAGLDRVPVDKILKKKITLYNARGVYSVPMAEWAVLRILEQYKNAAHFASMQGKGKWNKCRTLREIAGTKVAIIGAGNAGQEVAKRFNVFGATVIGFDIHTNPVCYFQEMHLISELSRLIGEYDSVVITAPLTAETFHLIDRKILMHLKSNAILINIARGPNVDEAALIEVLAERQDLYAALDVFEQEPLAEDSPLWKMKNVAVSPHNSFVSNGNSARMFGVIYENLKRYILA